MSNIKNTNDCRNLSSDEIDSVSGGYGGFTKDGAWVPCGSVVLINGTIYVGGINGPIARGR
jgi:hypothetical protein